MVEYIRKELVDRALRKQEKKNLKEKGNSLSWVSMLNYLNKQIVEVRPDENIIVMQEGWRDYVKTL